RPRLGDRACPRESDREEDRDVDDVVAPEVEDAAPAGLQELQARELAVAAVEDRVEEEEERARQLHHRPLGEEERRAREADAHGASARAAAASSVSRRSAGPARCRRSAASGRARSAFRYATCGTTSEGRKTRRAREAPGSASKPARRAARAILSSRVNP